MITTTAAFKAAVSASHTITTRVEKWSAAGQLQAVLYPTDGTVQIDARRATRRTCSLSFVDYDGTLVPSDTSSTLSPFNGHLRIYRGVVYPDGTQELVPLGRFTLVSTNLSAGNDGVTIEVEGEDFTRLFQDKRWDNGKALTPGANIATTIAQLVSALVPGQATNIASTTSTLPTTHTITLGKGLTQNAWDDISLIAQSNGWEAWFDAYGVLTVGAHPVIPTSGGTAIAYGSDSLLLGVSRNLTMDGAVNKITVTAEGAGIPAPLPAGYATDDSASSPTSTKNIPLQPAVAITTPIVKSNTTADAVAALLLRAYVGQPIEWKMVCDPSYDARDTVRLTDPRINLDATAIVDALEIPLNGAEMSCKGRTVTLR